MERQSGRAVTQKRLRRPQKNRISQSESLCGAYLDLPTPMVQNSINRCVDKTASELCRHSRVSRGTRPVKTRNGLNTLHQSRFRPLTREFGAMETMQIEGQSAIVTGGASGLGAATAKLLARTATKVAATSLPPACLRVRRILFLRLVKA